MFHVGLFADTTASGKENNKSNQAIQIIQFTSHRYKAKKLHICPFMADAETMEGSDSGNKANVPNLSTDSRLCSRHFDKEKIRTGDNTKHHVNS